MNNNIYIDNIIHDTNIRIKEKIENINVDIARNIPNGVIGVYVFWLKSGDTYIGMSEGWGGIRSRIHSHTREGWQRKIIKGFNIYITETIGQALDLERIMICKLKPELNSGCYLDMNTSIFLDGLEYADERKLLKYIRELIVDFNIKNIVDMSDALYFVDKVDKFIEKFDGELLGSETYHIELDYDIYDMTFVHLGQEIERFQNENVKRYCIDRLEGAKTLFTLYKSCRTGDQETTLKFVEKSLKKHKSINDISQELDKGEDKVLFYIRKLKKDKTDEYLINNANWLEYNIM